MHRNSLASLVTGLSSDLHRYFNTHYIFTASILLLDRLPQCLLTEPGYENLLSSGNPGPSFSNCAQMRRVRSQGHPAVHCVPASFQLVVIARTLQ
jgi:hypothetical protein